MKKIILFSTISVLLSACGGSSSRDNNFANGQNPVVNSVKLSTGQTIQLRGTGVITSVDPNTTVNASTGSSLNNNIQGSTYAGGYASDTSYAFVETNRAGYTSMPQFSGNVSDVPTTGTAIYAGEIYTLKHLQSGDGSNSVVRQVNDGVAVGSARFDVDFASKTLSGDGLVNYAHKLEEITINDPSGATQEVSRPSDIPGGQPTITREPVKITVQNHTYSHAEYKLDNVSFNDLKNGTAKSDIKLLQHTRIVNPNAGVITSSLEPVKDSLGSNIVYTGKAKGNFYGVNAKDLAGSIIVDQKEGIEHNAAFHTRKQ